MHPGAGHLADGVETRDGGGGHGIRAHATHPVVGGWRYRDRGGGGLKAQFTAAPKDRGELLLQLRAAHRAQV